MIYMILCVKEYSFDIIQKSELWKFLFSIIVSIIICLILDTFLIQLNLLIRVLIDGIVYMSLFYLILILLKENLICLEIAKVMKKLKGNDSL